MSLADLALNAGRRYGGAPGRAVDIITFVESSWGLNMKLFPVQRVILKAHYGLALDDNPHNFDLTQKIPTKHPRHKELADVDGYYRYRIPVSDWRRSNIRYMSEKEYLRFLYEDGRCNIAEVTPGEERREMILSIGRRSGKCVTGDTLVLTDRGVIRIDQLGDPDGPEIQPLRIGVAQEGTAKSETAYFYNGGVKPIFKFRSHHGFELGGTGNHRVKVMAEDGTIQWRYLADIKVGDYVAAHRKTDLWAAEYLDTTPYHNTTGRRVFPLPRLLDERWGLLLGLLVGDGTWGRGPTMEITVGPYPEYRDQVYALYEELFGPYRGPCLGHIKTHWQDSDGRVCRIRFHHQGVRNFLHDLGWTYRDYPDHVKEVPWAIMRSPRPVVCAFLKGLFETDGSVEGPSCVSFSTASEVLAKQVQVLLLNLGVVARRTTKIIEEKPYHHLHIYSRQSRMRFRSEVGFWSQRKQDLLSAGLDATAIEQTSVDLIPNQRPWVRALYGSVSSRQGCRTSGYVKMKLRGVLGGLDRGTSKGDLSYYRIRQLVPVAEMVGASDTHIQHFRDLEETGYFYDPVVSVVHGEERVYDLNVPNGASFVANGMTNHNTTICGCIIAYESYKLLNLQDPQKFYGLPATNVIQLISVATDKDQAGLLYQEASGHFRNCSFFSPYTANNTQSYARFQSPADVQRYGSYKEDQSAKATIKITFRSCVAKGLRGAGNIVVVLDEVAHFGDAGQSGADEVYNAVTPSVAAYTPKNPADPTKPVTADAASDGRIILISSPLGKQGLFYNLYDMGMKNGRAARNMLCIRAPTWEVNPTVPSNEFEKHYAKNPGVFFTEFGGEFTDRTLGWLEPQDLETCIDPALRPATHGLTRRPHFVGLDIGLKGDATAIAIGHIDQEGKVVVDLVDQIKAGEGKYLNADKLDFDSIVEWIHEHSRRFYFSEGMFDQHAGIILEQALQKKGLRQVTMMNMTKNRESEMFQNFKYMLWDQRLRLYDHPIPDGEEHCDYIAELLTLQAMQQTKHIITVEAPKKEGCHDDRSDALVRMVWLATQHASKSNYVAGSSRPGQPQNRYHLNHKSLLRARQSGSSPDRMVPRRGTGWTRRGTGPLGGPGGPFRP